MAMITLDDRYVHVMDGRIRVKVPSIRRRNEAAAILANDLSCLSGVISVQANPTTANVLVRFDPHVVDTTEVLSAIGHLSGSQISLPTEDDEPEFEIHPLVANVGRELGKQLLKSALPGWAGTLVDIL